MNPNQQKSTKALMRTDSKELTPILSGNYICELNNFGIVQVQGRDASNFLQGQLTCDVKKLNETYSSAGAVCDYKGRMLANFWIWREQDNFYLLLPSVQIQTLLNHLKKYAVFSKVTLQEYIELNCYVGGGDNIEHLIKAATSNKNLRIMQLPGSVPRFILVGTHEILKNAWQQLSSQVPCFDESAFKLGNILAGFVFLYPETSLLFTPQMINLEKFDGVSFKKGCYVGQEVVARTQHLGKLKRHLYRGHLDSERCPTIGAELKTNQGESIGVIVEAAPSPNSGYELLAVIQDHAVNEELFYDAYKLKELKPAS